MLIEHERDAGAAQPAFVHPRDLPGITLDADHGGIGAIVFRRLLDDTAFASAVDFIDVSLIPPGSSIGRHEHFASEEVYYIASGTPLVTVDGDSRRLSRGDVSIVRSGQWHSLVNDTTEPVEIFVIQISVAG